jgi:hypothetical protein
VGKRRAPHRDDGGAENSLFQAAVELEGTTMPRSFPPPWSIVERKESFAIEDASGQALAFARVARAAWCGRIVP